MNDYGYKAVILRDASDWGRNTVRLMVAERRGPRSAYLRADGAWQEAEDGSALAEDIGLILPAEAIEAIAGAILEYQGDASHAATEARVLREWLAVERARVDKALGR